jgi:hypothetical protein
VDVLASSLDLACVRMAAVARDSSAAVGPNSGSEAMIDIIQKCSLGPSIHLV